ncbi:MAG: hypothetical protein QME16_00205 [Planctomycetota bacterium]|nr:hypothetical protein [Planctomycetota bacterium]
MSFLFLKDALCKIIENYQYKRAIAYILFDLDLIIILIAILVIFKVKWWLKMRDR